MTRYRVLKARFVYPDGVLVHPVRRQSRAGEFVQGDEFDAQANTLLRRAVRDGDIERVDPAHATKRVARAGAGASKDIQP